MNVANQPQPATECNAPRVRQAGSIRRTAAGFTMTELAVTIGVVGILATVAVPSFSSLIANQRAKAFASELYAALSETRSAAITLNQNVSVTAKSGAWANGWQVLGPNNGVLEDRGSAMGVAVAGAATVTYRPSGRLPSGTPAPMFVITTHSGGTTAYQCVSIDLGGHPYMHAAATC